MTTGWQGAAQEEPDHCRGRRSLALKRGFEGAGDHPLLGGGEQELLDVIARTRSARAGRGTGF